MALPVWGNLQKSQIDPETIEEAIDRIIQAHEDDPNAHVEAGESLQSHKAQEIIDHVVASIIADKIKDGEIKINKLDWDRAILGPSFESLDGWGQSAVGVGAAITINVGICRIKSGQAVGNITRIYIDHGTDPVMEAKDPFFQCIVDFSSAPAAEDVRVCSGLDDPFNINTDSFGFMWESDDNKMYAFSYDGAALTQTEIVGYEKNKVNTLKAAMFDNGETIKFYVNGVLKTTHSEAACYIDSNYLFAFANKEKGGNGGESAYIRNIIFCQDW